MDLSRGTVLNASASPRTCVRPIAPACVRVLLFQQVAGEQWVTHRGRDVAAPAARRDHEPVDHDVPLWFAPEHLFALGVGTARGESVRACTAIGPDLDQAMHLG